MYDNVQAVQCPIWGITGNWAVLRAQGCAIRGCVLLEPVRHWRSSVLDHAQPRRAPQRRFRPVAAVVRPVEGACAFSARVCPRGRRRTLLPCTGDGRHGHHRDPRGGLPKRLDPSGPAGSSDGAYHSCARAGVHHRPDERALYVMANVPLGPFASFEDALRAIEKHLRGVCHLTPDQT